MALVHVAQTTILALCAALSQAAQDPAPSPDAPKAPAPEAPKQESPATPGADTEKKGQRVEYAVLGGGCFWCLDAVYRRVPGVKTVVSGYAGGKTSRPTYPQVQTGLTGHAEVVQVVFDPEVVPYERLLEIFWHAHDPTTLNRQGPDVGTEYRSIILYTSDEQKELARKSMEEAQKEIGAPIVTEVAPLRRFWRAEQSHQDYYRRNRLAPYCRMYIAPKLLKLGVRP